MPKILIVEDDLSLNRGVSFALKREGYDVISAFSVKEARLELETDDIDFLLLDITLPDGNGLDLCNDIRKDFKLPIVFFTANDTEEDMLKGFECGCDDYIAKPFSLEVLKHKIKAMIRRQTNESFNEFRYKDLKIDFDRRKIYVKDKEIKLTVTEYNLLELLSENKGRVVTKEILLEKLWDNKGNFVDENTLNVNIRRLRKKIEKDSKKPEYIKTVFGIGYILGD